MKIAYLSINYGVVFNKRNVCLSSSGSSAGNALAVKPMGCVFNGIVFRKRHGTIDKNFGACLPATIVVSTITTSAFLVADNADALSRRHSMTNKFLNI